MQTAPTHQHEMGLEVCRQLCNRLAQPLGTCSIGYLTRLLKSVFDPINFEQSVGAWEFELARYEPDDTTQLPDQVTQAVLRPISAQRGERKMTDTLVNVSLTGGPTRTVDMRANTNRPGAD